MAKTKLEKANEKIAENVVKGYKAIENSVVGSYKKVEDAVVGAYKRVEDAFVGEFLTRDGETVEDAKVRMALEQEMQEEQHLQNSNGKWR